MNQSFGLPGFFELIIVGGICFAIFGIPLIIVVVLWSNRRRKPDDDPK